MKDHFPKIKEARELLLAQAEAIIQKYMDLIKGAEEAGDFETALKHTQWLIEHMKDHEGRRVIDTSVDKLQEAKGRGTNSGPVINLGFALAGMPNQPKALPIGPVVIDVKDENDPDSD